MTTLSPALLADAVAPGTLVSADGRTLPLRGTRLVVRAAGGLAAVRLIQTFANPHAEPLRLTYQLPLPADAAVGGFSFRLGSELVVGEIDRRSRARERFEQAIAQGHTAALLEQDRSSLFTQELGNVPPGAEVEAQIDIDQPLVWVDGGWEWRFPTTVAPRYLGAPGTVADAARVAVDVITPGAAIPPRLELELLIGDALAGAVRAASHALQVAPSPTGTSVAFAAAAGRVAMDRDVVVSWPVATPQVGVSLHTFRAEHGALAGQAFAQLTLVPPASGATALRRDLIVLLDISGSMSGAPLQQAQAVTSALLRSLTPDDRIELIAFASQPQAFAKRPMPATPQNVAAALAWLDALQASGGTEMHTAILAALASLRELAQRQVVVITDGLIGFEQQIVGTIKTSLPAHARVHVVGVGSAPNRTLTRGASRAGRGSEVLIGLDERAEAAAARLLAHTAAPIVDDLTLSGTALRGRAPAALPDVFGGAPARLALQLDPAGGSLCVRGVTANGPFVHELTVPPIAAGGAAAVARLFGREAVEDLEVELAAGTPSTTIDARIEALGLSHQISTRLTSWVAVAQHRVDPRAPQRGEVVPQELPYGMSVEQLGLRACIGAMPQECLSAMPPSPAAAPTVAPGAPRKLAASREQASDLVRREPTPPKKPAPSKRKSLFERMFGAASKDEGSSGIVAKLRVRSASEWLFELSGIAAWQVPDRVTVVFADGREVEFTVEAAHTTASGPLTAGALVRLALLAIDGLGTPARLRLHRGTEILDVAIA